MADPTERYAKIVGDAEKGFDRISKQAEAMFPTHARDAEKISREEQKKDYEFLKQTPDGLRMRLKQWRQAFGLKRAAHMYVQWVKEMERD